jgi:hypothetical protein
MGALRLCDVPIYTSDRSHADLSNGRHGLET